TPKRLTADYINKLEEELFSGEEVIPWSDPEPIPDVGEIFASGTPTGQPSHEPPKSEAPATDSRRSSDPSSNWTLEGGK
ncbi:MAG: hypothetical protein ABJO27_00235, partial [Pseudoruegeria sp.]